jgi:hypothetical protein
MASFALVTEGITDQVVIERIISTIIEDGLDEEVEVNILQPLRDATDEARQENGVFGGWEKVLEFCSSSELLSQALSFNQYLVIQLDTDCCEHPNFGLSYHKDGVELEPLDLIEDVKNIIHSKFSHEFIETYKDRIVFAIAVHSTECWFMPFYSTQAKNKSRTKSCEANLQLNLAKKDIHFEKTYNCYNKLSNCFNKLKDIEKNRALNISLNHFIESLKKLAPFDVTTSTAV